MNKKQSKKLQLIPSL